MKNKKRKNKAILIVALILCITIGYAALATTLNITGNSEIKNARWDIHFDNLVVDSSSVEATTPATIDSNKTTINYGLHLAKPGDSYSFTVDVVNEGTIDGMISVVSNTGLTDEQQKYIEYSITYNDGIQLQEKDGLKAGATKNIKVSVKYKDDINPEDLPSEEKTIDLTFRVEYVQADETVHEKSEPIMKSYTTSSTEDYHNNTYKNKVTKIVTKTNIDVPETAIESWDVSAEGNNSVVAYVEDDGTGNGTYSVTIGGAGGKVIANEDSSGLFYNFTALTKIDLSNFNTINVTDMSGMFYGCSSLTSLDLSHFNTSNVTSMTGMFNYCSSLTSLDLSNFNTSNVTNMIAMFSECSGLKRLNVSSFDTSNVTVMIAMFINCSSLTSLDLSKWNTSKVTDMSAMFKSCSGLTSLDLSNFNTSKVNNMGGMFWGCSSLTSLDLSNFDTSKVTNMSEMFVECSKLTTTITISNPDTSYGGAFYGAATESNAQITVNYISKTSDLVDKIIADSIASSSSSNVVKGTLVS